MHQSNSLRIAIQEAEMTTGRCHRQALWCGTHFSSWPSKQEPGCNDFTATVEATEALLLASAKRGGR